VTRLHLAHVHEANVGTRVADREYVGHRRASVRVAHDAARARIDHHANLLETETAHIRHATDRQQAAVDNLAERRAARRVLELAKHAVRMRRIELQQLGVVEDIDAAGLEIRRHQLR